MFQEGEGGGGGGGGGGMRGSPLAMLAAQCNKLNTKSPPPLADAAVGKGGTGFHPWKKGGVVVGGAGSGVGQSLTGGQAEDTQSAHSSAGSPQPSSPAQSNYSAHSTASPVPQYGKFAFLSKNTI